MARYLIIWRANPVAPWPTDPEEYLKFLKASWVALEDLMKKGEMKEFGFFLDGQSGYAIAEGDGVTTFKNASMFNPFWPSEVMEIIPYEAGKKISNAIVKARIEAAKK